MKLYACGAVAAWLLLATGAEAQEAPSGAKPAEEPPSAQPAESGNGQAPAPEPPAEQAAPPSDPAPPAPAPEPPPVAAPKKEAPPGPKSPLLIGTGTAAVAIGVTGMIIGGILLPIGLVLKDENTCQNKSGSLTFDCEYGSAGDMVPAGAIALGAGAALLIGGVIMIAVGKEPARSTASHGRVLRWVF
jgi:hypothetical protein